MRLFHIYTPEDSLAIDVADLGIRVGYNDIGKQVVLPDDTSLVKKAIAARKQGEKSSWDEADAYQGLAEKGWIQKDIALACATTQQRVSKFTICAKNYSLVSNRPDFWEAFQEVNSTKKTAHVANNSGNNEWYTPPEFIEAARKAMGSIDTDPASSEIANKTVKALQFFDAESDGLTQTWVGNVWMNPPYAQPLIEEFCGAVTDKFTRGEIEQACVLVNNGTETAWFQILLTEAKAVCFPQSRIRFLDPSGNPSGAPLQGQAVVYFGSHVGLFAENFSRFGKVLLG